MLSCVAALAWTGTAQADQYEWTDPISVQRSAGGFSMRAVDCPSAALCVGVDGAGQSVAFDPVNPGAGSTRGVLTTPEAIAAGKSCQPLSMPNDGGSSCAISLTAVSCPTTTLCAAVSSRGAFVFDPASPEPPTTVSVPGGPSGIDCPSATLCVASSFSGAVTRFNPQGGGPTSESLPGAGFISGVACPSSTQCTAIGGQGTDSKLTTFDPANAAATAQIVTVPNEALSLIECAGTTQCTAIDAGSPTRAATFNPQSAAVPAVATLGSSSSAMDLACSAVSRCIIVNRFGAASAFDPQTVTSVPGILQLNVTYPVYGVSCPTVGQCTAVDAEGQAHTLDPQDLGAGASNDVVDPGAALLGVSCPSATFCTTVSYAGDGSDVGSTGFINGFNPQNPGAGVSGNSVNFLPLTDVDCPSEDVCVAVDRAGLASVYDPPSLAPGGAQVSPHPLLAIDCPSTDQCTATSQVGTEVTFDPTSAFGVQTPGGTGNGYVFGISCPTLTQCTNVDQSGLQGTFDPADPNNTLSSNILAPSTSIGRALAVSCPDATECTAGTTLGFVIDFQVPSGNTLRFPDTGHGVAAVECLSLTRCVLGDTDGGASLWGRSNSGGPDRVQLEGASNIISMSCPTATLCVAVDGVGQAFVGTLVEDPTNITPPTIAGTPTQGQTLTVIEGTWTGAPTSFGHQWLRCDAGGGACVPIPLATGTSYELTADDVGRTIRVEETATNAGGTSAAVQSAATPLVTATSANGGGGGGTGTPSIGEATASGLGVTVPVTCTGPAGSRCDLRFRLSARRIFRDGRLAAVKPPKKKGRKRLTLGSAVQTVPAGETRDVKIALNDSGLRLLAKLQRIRVKLEEVCGAVPPQKLRIRGNPPSPPSAPKGGAGGGGRKGPTCG